MLGFGATCIKIVVSMATDSSHRLTMGKHKSSSPQLKVPELSYSVCSNVWWSSLFFMPTVPLGSTQAKLRGVMVIVTCQIKCHDNVTTSFGLLMFFFYVITIYCRFRCMDPYGSKPIMGVHMAIDQEGKVKVGDPVYVVRK